MSKWYNLNHIELNDGAYGQLRAGTQSNELVFDGWKKCRYSWRRKYVWKL